MRIEKHIEITQKKDSMFLYHWSWFLVSFAINKASYKLFFILLISFHSKSCLMIPMRVKTTFTGYPRTQRKSCATILLKLQLLIFSTCQVFRNHSSKHLRALQHLQQQASTLTTTPSTWTSTYRMSTWGAGGGQGWAILNSHQERDHYWWSNSFH